MLTVFVRVVILYGLSVLAMRLMGKRQVGQLQPYELVLALMVAEIGASPMEDMNTPLFYGLVPMLGLVFLHGVGTALSMKCMPVRRMLFGMPGVVIRDGALDEKQMRLMGYTVTDLMEELRGLGYEDVSRVHTAVLETNGRLTAFPKAAFAPLTPGDLGLETPEEGMPHLLIMDGRVQKKHLQECGRDEKWLWERLGRAGMAPEGVLLCSLNGRGEMFVQAKNRHEAVILPGEEDAACGGR